MSNESLLMKGVLVNGLLDQARAARHRRILVLSGDKSWCRSVGQKIVEVTQLPRVLWVSDIDLPTAEVVAGHKVKALLGQERDLVVFDAHAGFDPDAFGVVSGIIPGGGLLLLLCPPFTEWEQIPDPASERIAIWPCDIADIRGRFIKRLVNILDQTRVVTTIQQDHDLPELEAMDSDTESATFQDELFASKDQQVAVEAIEHVLHGHRHRPLVLVSDRGRGKSSALGIAASRLLLAARAPLRIVVTAPRPDAVNTLFAQARHLLPKTTHTSGYSEFNIAFNFSSIEFYAPDVLCLSEVDADLVLVDEAAAIPAGLLQQLLNRYPRLVFATTVHGYEGTGRGFAVRFRRVLESQTPGWREVTLHTPIRWAEHDPLEQLVFRALLLDAEAATDDEVNSATLADVHIEHIERDDLLADEQTLAQLFGLLVVAHYRTTPNDLRNLLDGPGLSVYVMRFQGHVVATALVSAEGGFDPALAKEIYEGRRRPRGHLLAQSLLAHIGIQQATALKCARIMRIAVHPALQRTGLGKTLVAHIQEAMQQDGVDVLGASFGATAELLRFWEKAGLLPVRAGFHRDHASGEHSVMVLAPLTNNGSTVFALARERFHRDLPHWLADPLRDLDALLAEFLFTAGGVQAGEATSDEPVTAQDMETLQIFAHGLRSYEDSLGPIWRLCVQDLEKADGKLSDKEKQLLISKVLQRQPWGVVAETCGLSGRAEVLGMLRSAVENLLDSDGVNGF